MLLFGISTAYIFAVVQVCWPVLSGPMARRSKRRAEKRSAFRRPRAISARSTVMV
jgi:hypothetical protein